MGNQDLIRILPDSISRVETNNAVWELGFNPKDLVEVHIYPDRVVAVALSVHEDGWTEKVEFDLPVQD